MAKIALPMARRVQRAGYPQAVQELKLQTQKLLGLSDDVTISVSELSCREPGCPDVETIVAILRDGEKPTIARVHKSIPEVTLDELKAAFDLRRLPTH
ncbi:nitrate reductase [Bradyrhizobium diversitatis]|nr:nitrate reductase [Bradyrhizobium diversitatis]